MKEIIKKLLNELVDLVAIPFEWLYKFIKNADNIIYVIARAVLLVILFFVVIYFILARPYKKLFSGFQFEKYSTGKEAKTALLKQFPLDNTSIEEYNKYLTKIGAKCYKSKNGRRCFYRENLIFKEYNWVVNVRETEKGKSLSVSIKKPKNAKKASNKDDKNNKYGKNTKGNKEIKEIENSNDSGSEGGVLMGDKVEVNKKN